MVPNHEKHINRLYLQFPQRSFYIMYHVIIKCHGSEPPTIYIYIYICSIMLYHVISCYIYTYIYIYIIYIYPQHIPTISRLWSITPRPRIQVDPGPSGPSAWSAPVVAKSPLLLPCYLAGDAMALLKEWGILRNLDAGGYSRGKHFGLLMAIGF